jgi:hypothetical protein
MIITRNEIMKRRIIMRRKFTTLLLALVLCLSSFSFASEDNINYELLKTIEESISIDGAAAEEIFRKLALEFVCDPNTFYTLSIRT